MLKQYFYIIFLLYIIVNINLAKSDDTLKPYVKDALKNDTTNINSSSILKSTNSIPSEGGGKIIVTNQQEIQGREQHQHVHVQNNVQSSSSTPATTIEKNNLQNTTSSSVTINNTLSTITTISPIANNVTLQTIKNNRTSTENIKPVSEIVEATGDSKVKARKGVTLPELLINSTVNSGGNNHTLLNTTLKLNNNTASTTTTTTTTITTTTITTTTKKPTSTTFHPRKPTVTIGSDDEIPVRLPPKLFINSKEVLPKNYTNSSAKIITGGDHVIISSARIQKGPDYVLPIVLTILAVPLLAIILTVVYKRGSEWWQHRHYRRMDFLIDGMYNN